MKLRALLLVSLLAPASCSTPTAPAPVAPVAEELRGELRLEPDPLVFEETLVGCSRTARLRLENTDPDTAITVTGIASPNAALGLEQATPAPLGAGGSTSLAIRFAPAEAGDFSGEMSLISDQDGGTMHAFRVTASGADAPRTPLDLVFVLDVSTTMDEIANLRGAIAALFAVIAEEGLDVRLGLTTFENDIIVHGRGEFLDRTTFFEELDSQLIAGSWVPNPALNRQLVNLEPEENLLGALHRSTTDFDFRPDARRFFFVMTDATFLEHPAVFSDGTPARQSYGEVAAALDATRVRLFAVSAPSHGRGLSSDYDGRPSLVSLTGGTARDIERVTDRSLETMLRNLLVQPDCR